MLSLVLAPAFYAIAPSLVRDAGGGAKRRRVLPFRDELRYWLVPWKQNERSAELFAAAALQQAAPDGVILPDTTSDEPLLLVQMRDALSTGVSVQYRGAPLPPYERSAHAFRAAAAARKVFVVSPATSPIPENLLVPPAGRDDVLYRVEWNAPSGPSTRP